MQYHGSCHCGAVEYQVEGQLDSVLSCNCSICSRRGYLLWFVPASALTFSKAGALTSYTFNSHKIKHQFCPVCGCAPFGLGVDPQGNQTAAVNVRCLTDVDLNALQVHHYNGKDA
ncbi:GFA family protein [Rheinheimera sp.]|uniref:GFA family protein n=1 Tax=Rheinheimera sp. TaxID=1869214 RepID=UPI00307F42BE